MRLIPILCLQELRESRRRFESHVVELDGGQRLEFESKLAAALVEMRAQQEEQVRLYKEEVEKTYNSKVGLDAAAGGALLPPTGRVETVGQIRFEFRCFASANDFTELIALR